MKRQKYLLGFLVVIIFLCFLSVGNCQDDSGKDPNQQHSIIFGTFDKGKQKWQGPMHDKAIFPWLTITTEALSQGGYKELIQDQRRNGVKYIGYYYSATTCLEREPLRFPERALPTEECLDKWLLKDPNGLPVKVGKDTLHKYRYWLDVGNPAVQVAVLSRAVSNAKSVGADVLYLDNWYYKSWAPPGQTRESWTEKCFSFLKMARKLTEEHNMKLIVNLVAPFETWTEFAPYLDGISYEMSTHPEYLTINRTYEVELDTYEQMMKIGKSVFIYSDILKYKDGRWDEDGRKVAATAMLVMPENQPYWGGIYVALPRYEPWPAGGWFFWPKQLGRPLGRREINGDTITRKFERGTISVTLGNNFKFSIQMNY